MNASVQATGMQITAKSNSVFLLIGSGESDTYAEIQSDNTVTTALTVDSEAAQVYPSAHDSITNTTTATATNVSHNYQYHLTSNNEKVISLEQFAALPSVATDGLENDQLEYTADTRNGTNWYYKIADDVAHSTSSSEGHYLQTIDSSYIIHKICYVTLAAGSETADNLKVKDMAIASNSTATGGSATITPVKVLVTSSEAAVELDSSVRSSNTVLATHVYDNAVVQLDIFIYYNGADAAVYTNNKANLDGATISLTFGIGA